MVKVIVWDFQPSFSSSRETKVKEIGEINVFLKKNYLFIIWSTIRIPSVVDQELIYFTAVLFRQKIDMFFWKRQKEQGRRYLVIKICVEATLFIYVTHVKTSTSSARQIWDENQANVWSSTTWYNTLKMMAESEYLQ